MGLYRLKGAVLTVTVVAVATAAQLALADVGVRGIGMGQAYVAVADGPEAAYWNPAGLAFESSRQILVSGALNGHSSHDNDAYAVYSEGFNGKLAGALSLGIDASNMPASGGPSYYGGMLAYSLAAKLQPGLAVGASAKYEMVHEYTVEDTGESAGGQTGKGLSVDAGVMAKIGQRLMLGLVVQDVVGTAVRWGDGSSYRYTASIRPGMAYRPDAMTVLAMEIYNAGALVKAGGVEPVQVRVGAERLFTLGQGGHLGLRAGGGRLLDGSGGFFTLGAGYEGPKGLRVDYGYRKRFGAIGDSGVHLIGVGTSL